MLSKWLWTMLCFVEWVGVNHGVLCWASGCELCRVMLSQWLWLWIMLCYAEPGCYESQCAMLSQWLQIIANYAEQVVVNHVVLCWVGGCESWCFLCWASGCESWCVMMSQWLWIMDCHAVPKVVNHGELCWASGCESWCVMLSQWLLSMVFYAEPVVVNHGV